jgi:bacteriocin-like protein
MPIRVIHRTGARELTAEELNQISGGSRIPVTSLFPPTVDGIITD